MFGEEEKRAEKENRGGKVAMAEQTVAGAATTGVASEAETRCVVRRVRCTLWVRR